MKRIPTKVPIACVIGYPVKHSISPAIFEFLSKRLKTPLVYRRLEVAPGQLQSWLHHARDSELFLGWNVTIPHKETVLKGLESVSKAAQAIGACNVVQFNGRATLGHNTDVQGIIETLRECSFQVKDSSACLIGAGGAARAAAFALAQGGCKKIWIKNRSQARARKLVKEFSKTFKKTHFEVISSWPSEKTDLVIQTTPVGMTGIGGVLELPASVKGFTPHTLAFDVIYRPQLTPFLKSAKRLGLSTVGGLDMLVWQAIATWQIWFKDESKTISRARWISIKHALRKHLEKEVL